MDMIACTGEDNRRSRKIEPTRGLRGLLALLGVTVVAGCMETQTATYEPQTAPRDARQARIYFIRHPSFLNGFGAPPIKVDGKLVGELGAGSYFTTDRAAGTHTLTIMDVRDQISCQSDINMEAGMSYYLELGPQVRTMAEGFTANSMGVKGRPIPCKYAELPRMQFYLIDAPAGAAVLTKLKAASS